MVGGVDGGIYCGAVGLPMVGMENIVNAHYDGIAIEGTAETVARACESIVQTAGNDAAVRIGDRRIVEIATEDDITALERVEIRSQYFYLLRTKRGRMTDF